MADYTALTTVKNLPKGIHSATRYIKTFPAMASNAAWGDAYRVKFNEYPTNWSWENAAALSFLTAAAKKANSADSEKLAEVLPGMTIDSPFGEGGKLTIRADDHTLINYAIGWGTTIPTEPYVPNITPANWNQICHSRRTGRRKTTTPEPRLSPRACAATGIAGQPVCRPTNWSHSWIFRRC